jgi:hypothetical protein
MSAPSRACYVTHTRLWGHTYIVFLRHTVMIFKTKTSARPSTCPLGEKHYNNLALAYKVYMAYVEEKLLLSDRFCAVK